MLEDIFVPFIAIGLAELGDKTQLMVLSLSSETKKYSQLLLGVILAFALADGSAILLGSYLPNLIPPMYLKIVVGILFILFGVLTLVKTEESKRGYEMKHPFLTGFGLVFLAELGDKTQIASGLFATEYHPLLVFIGVMLALTLLSFMAMYFGRFLAKKIKKKTISLLAGGLFVAIGILTLVGAIL